MQFSFNDPRQHDGDSLRLGKLRQRGPTRRHRHWSAGLHVCAYSFLGRAFRAPTDGRTCDSRHRSAGYFVGSLARDQRTKGPKSEPQQLSTPHVSLLHTPPQALGSGSHRKESGCRSTMSSYGLGFFTSPLPHPALNSSALIFPSPSPSTSLKLTM